MIRGYLALLLIVAVAGLAPGCASGDRSTFGFVGAHHKSRKFPVVDEIEFIPRPRFSQQGIIEKFKAEDLKDKINADPDTKEYVEQVREQRQNVLAYSLEKKLFSEKLKDEIEELRKTGLPVPPSAKYTDLNDAILEIDKKMIPIFDIADQNAATASIGGTMVGSMLTDVAVKAAASEFRRVANEHETSSATFRRTNDWYYRLGTNDKVSYVPNYFAGVVTRKHKDKVIEALLFVFMSAEEWSRSQSDEERAAIQSNVPGDPNVFVIVPLLHVKQGTPARIDALGAVVHGKALVKTRYDFKFAATYIRKDETAVHGQVFANPSIEFNTDLSKGDGVTVIVPTDKSAKGWFTSPPLSYSKAANKVIPSYNPGLTISVGITDIDPTSINKVYLDAADYIEKEMAGGGK